MPSLPARIHAGKPLQGRAQPLAWNHQKTAQRGHEARPPRGKEIQMNIEPGKFYRTRDGKKARIYATDGGSPYQIHGAVQCDEVWVSHTWTKDGIFREGTLQADSDLISEWREEPEVPWERVPIECKWVAMDAGGRWFGYTTQPTACYGSWAIDNTGHAQLLFPSQTPKNYTGGWRESLTKRPE